MNDLDYELLADKISARISETRHVDEAFIGKIADLVVPQVVSQISDKIVCCNPEAYEEKFGVTPIRQREIMQKSDRWFKAFEDSKSIVRKTIIIMVVTCIVTATAVGLVFNFHEVVDAVDKIPK